MGWARCFWEQAIEGMLEPASALYSRKMEWKSLAATFHDMWARDAEIWNNTESSSSILIARQFSFQRDAGKA